MQNINEPKVLWNATEQEGVYKDTQIIKIDDSEVLLEIYEPLSFIQRLKVLFTGSYEKYYRLPLEIFYNDKQDN